MAYEAYLRGRVPALITAVLTLLSMVLSFIALLSTSQQFPLEQFSIVTIDTTNFLFDAVGLDVAQALSRREVDSEATIPVEVSRDARAAAISTTAASVVGEATPAPSDAEGSSNGTNSTDSQNPDLFGFGGGRGGGFGGIGTGNPGTGNTGTGNTGTGNTGTGTGSTTGIDTNFPANTFLGDMQLVFANLLGAARGDSRVGTDFGTQLNDFFGDITGNFGIQNFYAFYMSDICDGEFFNTGNNNENDNNNNDNDEDENENTNNDGEPLIFDTRQCIRYTSLSSTSFGGSNTFNVGGSILDFGNFNFLQRFADGRSGFNNIFVAIFIIQILGIVSLFILLLLATIYVCLRVRLLSILISTFVFLAFIFFLVVAVLVTSVNVFITNLINSVFDGIGLRATGGGPLLAILWANVGLVFLALFVWFAKWHRESFIRRSREKQVTSRSIGGGKAFPSAFLKGNKLKKGSTANSVANEGGAEPTPIHETYTKGKDVEYA